MKNTEKFENNLRGFKKWCKYYRWNSAFESEKEFYRITAKGFTLFLELSVNEFGESKMAFANYRVFDEENETFIIPLDGTPIPVLEKVKAKLLDYCERKEAVANW